MAITSTCEVPRYHLAPAARVGIGGPVGSGKTALVELLIPLLEAKNIETAVVTNDLVTKEDALRLQRSGLITPARVLAVEAVLKAMAHHVLFADRPTAA